jgi:thiol-disulfide isomerase/thioredoxin
MREQINSSRRSFLGAGALAFAAMQFGASAWASARSGLSSVVHATSWLNSRPITSSQLEGKVVLVNFWTYSCINWRRQLPYIRAWAEKYRNLGLLVVGVHSPEFSFEKNPENVRWATKDMDVTYPVVIDNDLSIWRAFDNNYWPALYLIDAKGRDRHHVFGEGQYDETEVLIQKLLSEAGASGIGRELVSPASKGAEAQADWRELKSGENYVGSARTQNFASPGGIKTGKAHTYSAAKWLAVNEWALTGNWTVGSEAIILNQPGGNILYRFHARDLHAVLGPAAPGKSIQFRLLIDGKPPGADHGVDVDEQGHGVVVQPRMYQLIRQQSHIADRQVTIEFLDSGVEAYSFTFG